ncbi:MAG: type II toxin-antitoxin system RelE/ParE family toxin [Campylobacterales bacterium]
MSFELIATPEFSRSAKRLHKKFRLLYKDLELLQAELERDPKAGVDLGGGCYKLRLPNSSVPTGKSGGFRAVYFFRDAKGVIYLLDIYTKTELASISEERLLEILRANGLE